MPYLPAITFKNPIEEELRNTAHPSVTDLDIKQYLMDVNLAGPLTKDENDCVQAYMREIYFVITGLDWE